MQCAELVTVSLGLYLFDTKARLPFLTPPIAGVLVHLHGYPLTVSKKFFCFGLPFMGVAVLLIRKIRSLISFLQFMECQKLHHAVNSCLPPIFKWIEF